MPGASLGGKEGRDLVSVPRSALLPGHVSKAGAACSPLARRQKEAGGGVSLFLNPHRLGRCYKTPSGAFFKECLLALFRNVSSVIYCFSKHF